MSQGKLARTSKADGYKSCQPQIGLQATLLIYPWGTSFYDKSFSLKGPACIAGGNVITATQENSCAFYYKTKHIPYNPAIQILSIHTRAMKNAHTKSYK